jgi:hypothetical protein
VINEEERKFYREKFRRSGIPSDPTDEQIEALKQQERRYLRWAIPVLLLCLLWISFQLTVHFFK